MKGRLLFRFGKEFGQKVWYVPDHPFFHILFHLAEILCRGQTVSVHGA
jgi:hypothetical protein